MKIIKQNKNRENLDVPAVRDLFGGVFSLRDAMERLFDESVWLPFNSLVESDSREKGLTMFVPRVDISETDTEIKIRADVPGIDSNKINIEVTEDSLTLSGSVEKTAEEKGENFYRVERQAGQFSRRFALPSKIDPDSVNAKAKNGTITIILKKQPSKQKRKIQIKTE